MPFMRSAAAALLMLTSLSPALAESASPLPAGKPAGTRQAAMRGDGLLWSLGLAAIIAATVVMVSEDHNKGVTTPSTSATGTGLP